VGSAPAKKTGATSGTTATARAGTSYTLEVEARSQGADRAWLGLREKARIGRDVLDFAQAPPIGGRVQVWAEETVAGRVVPHAGSFKPLPEDVNREGQSWTLRVANPSDETDREVRIRLREHGRLPDGHERYVLDLTTDRRVASGARLDLGPGEKRGLKVIVGTESFAKAESPGIGLNTFADELRGNYPNPFGEETTIAYTLSGEREVKIEIYDVLGRRVRRLVGETQAAGLHRVRWDGENRYGTPVGSGVYFYRIKAGDFVETRKMVLVR
jgi:hypothetical protein